MSSLYTSKYFEVVGPGFLNQVPTLYLFCRAPTPKTQEPWVEPRAHSSSSPALLGSHEDSTPLHKGLGFRDQVTEGSATSFRQQVRAQKGIKVYRDQGFGFRDQGLGFRDQGLGFRFRDQGLGFRDQGLGLGLKVLSLYQARSMRRSTSAGLGHIGVWGLRKYGRAQ